MDGEDGALLVVGAGELELQLELVELAFEALQKAVEIRIRAAFGQQLAPGVELLGVGVWRRRSRSRRFWRICALPAGLSQKPASCMRWSISDSSRSRSVCSKIPPEIGELLGDGIDSLLHVIRDHV
jgi:hypothetical protein